MDWPGYLEISNERNIDLIRNLRSIRHLPLDSRRGVTERRPTQSGRARKRLDLPCI